MDKNVTRNAVDRLEMALLRKHGTPANALRALGFDSNTIREIIEEEKTMITRRRLARDEEPGGFTAEELLDDLHKDVRDLPPEQHAEFLDGLAELVDGGSVEQWAAQDRRGRRARDDANGTDPANQFRKADTGTGSDRGRKIRVGRAKDAGQFRRARAMDSAPKSPIKFEDVFPGTAPRTGSAPQFDEIFPGAKR
jgi:hypothetical protein